MAAINTALFDIGGLEALASLESPIHRLDPRAKLLAALAFAAAVVTFGKYDISGLIPFLIYPVALAALAGMPARALLLRLALAAPFALCVGIFNPLLDRAVMLHLGPIAVSGGWVSFASLMLRVLLTLSAVLILIATTGMGGICLALARFRVPRVFIVQLLLLYRYLFVLIDEGGRMVRAHALRAGHGRMPMRVFGSLVGQLLVRALDRAQRIHAAMLCRGFDGEFHHARPLRARWVDFVFVAGWCAFFVLARRYDLPRLLGQAVMGIGH